MIEGSQALVTGGAGMIGSAIVDQLLAGGASHVRVLDDLSRGRTANLDAALASGKVSVRSGDIRDRARVGEALDGVDLVFHQAAIRITQCASNPREALEVMVGGAFNVVEAAAAAGVRRVIAASSGSIYGMATRFPTPEDHHPYSNRTLYGAAKLFNEGLLRAFADTHGLEYIALRYFNVYGPRMNTSGPHTEVLVRWMDRIAAGLPPVIHGDGSQTADYVYVEDAARANVLAAECAASDEALNIATGVGTRLDELAAALVEAMNAAPLRPEYAPERQVNSIARREGDPTRAREVLGFEPHVQLREGLRRLVGWWEAQR